MAEKIVFAWSSGKDSSMALHVLRAQSQFKILALLTTVTQDYDRISMHGVLRVLLEQQAESIGIPLDLVYISKNSSNQEYETQMNEKLLYYKNQGISGVAFGDIFLEDLKKYREENLAKLGLLGIFPVWKRNTLELANAFIGLGFKAIITCIDSKVLGKEFAGREFNKQFLADLPSTVDPCGENGEFHSFVYAGPIFKTKISFNKGEIVLRDNRFYFCDLVPV
ncbi:MAG: ATP-binding protein [Candidatus Diapherotrites archaeon]|nr:ATP-binding protein [Candidatus Diapherotrites archaeon]